MPHAGRLPGRMTNGGLLICAGLFDKHTQINGDQRFFIIINLLTVHGSISK